MSQSLTLYWGLTVSVPKTEYLNMFQHFPLVRLGSLLENDQAIYMTGNVTTIFCFQQKHFLEKNACHDVQ